jgi:hypothetical protein
MHGPRWGTREEELMREYKVMIHEKARLRTENYVLRWLLAEARWCNGGREASWETSSATKVAL